MDEATATEEQPPRPVAVQTFENLSSGRGMGGRKLSVDSLRLARREAVWSLRMLGWTQDHIAEELKMKQKTVSRDLKWCHKTYEDRLMGSVGQVKLEQKVTLQEFLEETIAAWERSKLEALEVQRKSVQTQASSGPGQKQVQAVVTPVEQTTRVKGQTGDVAYLREARSIMKDIRQIVGADAPTKVAMTDPTGRTEAKGSTVIVVPSRMSMAEALGDVVEVDEENEGSEEPAK